MSKKFTRRDFGKMALAGPPLASAWLSGRSLSGASKPNSRIAGVQIGIISSSLTGMAAADIIPNMLKIGLNEVELQSAHAEALAGAPSANPGVGRAGAAPGGSTPTLNADGLMPRCADMQMVLSPLPPGTAPQAGRGRGPLTPEQETAQQRLKQWRSATTPETWKGVRKQFDDAGIELRLLWYGLGYMGPAPSDDDIGYAFRMAQGLGVRAMSGSSTIPIAKRIAVAAEKYKIHWGGHTQDDIHNLDQFVTPGVYEQLLSLSPYLSICLDVGYFTAAGFDAVPFIQKNHARITDIHLKDRKRSASLGGDVTNNLLNNWPWGQGDAPIREVLQLLKKEKYDIPCNIEYDYGCRTASDPVTEISRCYAYARNSLA
jgi:sugar phosphate isomerase/epimerase